MLSIGRCELLSRCYCFEVIQTIAMKFPASTVSSSQNVLIPVYKRQYNSQIQAALAYWGKQLGFDGASVIITLAIWPAGRVNRMWCSLMSLYFLHLLSALWIKALVAFGQEWYKPLWQNPSRSERLVSWAEVLLDVLVYSAMAGGHFKQTNVANHWIAGHQRDTLQLLFGPLLWGVLHVHALH